MTHTIPQLPIPEGKLTDLCQRWKIIELSLFGSALREDFQPDSDIDLLVKFAPDARVGLFGLVRLQNELKEIFGRSVDLIDRRAIENSDNYIRRDHILNSLEPLYVA